MTIKPRRMITSVLMLTTLVAAACDGGVRQATPGTAGRSDATVAGSASPTAMPSGSDSPSATGGVSPEWSGAALEPVGVAADGTNHPRLWITAAQLPHLRAWASDANPVWSQGLSVELRRVRGVVDSGKASDDGSSGWVQDPVEADAELLAFGSLVDPSPTNRSKDAERARRLLMAGISAAAAGPRDDMPYRSPNFSIDDRSRWWGEGWALAVDWIYPVLTAQDKAEIRTVFLRWSQEDERGGQTTSDHPEPTGRLDDPALLADPLALRWSENNYFTAHARNIVLMSLALDPSDDPDGRLRGQLANVTGGFLYMTDALLRGDGRGGAPAEGFEYGPQSLGYVAETLLALHTAGNDDTARFGGQVSFAGNPFWDQTAPFLLNALSPAPGTDSNGQQVWLPATYGDSQRYHNPDWIELFGTLGIYDETVGGNAARLATSRWIETQTPDGGAAGLLDRISDPEAARDSILYFMLLDPAAPPPQDPRPSLGTSWLAAGVGRFSARSGWDDQATWFNFGIGWNQIDHQNGDGLSISLFRNGEWLTKERSGYDVFTSDQKNTLAIQNDPPEHNDNGDYRQLIAETGSQFTYVPTGPGRLTARSVAKDYVFVSGNATDLYNSASEGSTDVVQATRDVVWLEPDIAVVYDRATTNKAGRFKRFFLQLPGRPSIVGHQALATTAAGQQLEVTTLLPTNAVLSGEKVTPDANGTLAGEGQGQVADGEPMNYRLRVDAPGGPADVRFLDVLAGLDRGVRAIQETLVRTTSGSPYDGAVTGGTLVLFPVDAGVSGDLRVQVPSDVSRIIVTGLQPSSGYQVTTAGGELRVRPGGGQMSDAGGVLDIISPR